MKLTMEQVEQEINDGCWDDLISYEGQEPKNIARVGRYILHTDSQGFRDMEIADSEEEAEAFMDRVRAEDFGEEN